MSGGAAVGGAPSFVVYGMRLPRYVPVLAATALIAGCAGNHPDLSSLPARELSGHFTASEGASWFLSCGAAPSDSSWWVTFTGRSVAQMDSIRSAGVLRPGDRSFVRWRAAVTERGEVGPRGPGVPALLVREILELRAAAPGDCSAR